MLWKIFTHQKFIGSIKTLTKSTKMPLYAVARGRTAGIFMSWPECEAQVKGFPGARYKKFDSADQAHQFITTEGGANTQRTKPSSSNSRFNNNFKRSYSTSSNFQNDDVPKKRSKTKQTKDSDSDSDNSDDLNTLLSKQLDDVEERLRGFGKGIDKICKKNSKTILIEPQVLNRHSSDSKGFNIDNEGFVQVYTDGACSANGRSGARAGLGVYWGDGHALNISEPVSGRATNNCGEIQAATRAIKQAISQGVTKLAINTDSKFLINSVTKWIPGWKRKGWKLQSGAPVKNELDFKDLDSVQNRIQIKWNYVEAHRGIHGNEMADQLAKAGASKYNK